MALFLRSVLDGKIGMLYTDHCRGGIAARAQLLCARVGRRRKANGNYKSREDAKMNQQLQHGMPPYLDSLIFELDEADLEEIEYTIPGYTSPGLPEMAASVAGSVVRTGRGSKKVWLFNTAWVALCLVILTGALWFSMRLLAG
jgi:hypothetical protein